MFCPPDYPLTGQTVPLPSGVAGTRATVRAMRALVDQSKIDPDLIHCAATLIFLTPEEDTRAEITALYNAVAYGVRYVRDVSGVEPLCTPLMTLNRRVGDCDDQATALAALLEAVGYPTRFVVAGYRSREFEHVYLQVWDDEQWIDLDPTRREGVGWAPENPVIIEYERT